LAQSYDIEERADGQTTISTSPAPHTNTGGGVPLHSVPYAQMRSSMALWARKGIVDATAPEKYLLETDVARVLEVRDLEEFSNLPVWKQIALRKKAKLWVEVR
jgi:hypothetical protein